MTINIREFLDSLRDALESLENGDIESVKEWLRAAIKLLERQLG